MNSPHILARQLCSATYAPDPRSRREVAEWEEMVVVLAEKAIAHNYQHDGVDMLQFPNRQLCEKHESCLR